MHESRCLSGKSLLVIIIAPSLSLALISLDQTIVATALPVIISDFDALQDVTWINVVSGLTVRKAPYRNFKLHMTAIVIFELGSFFCPVVPFVNVLVFGRAFAGIGAGGISMSVLTIMTEISSRRLAAIGALFDLSNIVGPLLGGPFTTCLL
ncbi:MFS gliotoxin efflux transporter glia [Tylopilus felleus]